MARWREWEYFPRSVPRAVKGGIRAQTARGGFGKSWWAKRWIAVLESFDIGARLQRGRSYARRGQVMNIEIGKGCVTAEVQGSRPKPYQVRIAVAPIDAKKFRQALSSEAVYAAKLLAGEMPEDIEQVLARAGVSLFPERQRDLTTECSCPDWSNPCKHVAAVYYLLGEEFDRDPFLILRMRGVPREELGFEPVAEVERPEPLRVDEFWKCGAIPRDLTGDVTVPRAPAALTKRLGGFPFWRGTATFQAEMERIYTAAAKRALELLQR